MEYSRWNYKEVKDVVNQIQGFKWCHLHSTRRRESDFLWKGQWQGGYLVFVQICKNIICVFNAYYNFAHKNITYMNIEVKK